MERKAADKIARLKEKGRYTDKAGKVTDKALFWEGARARARELAAESRKNSVFQGAEDLPIEQGRPEQIDPETGEILQQVAGDINRSKADPKTTAEVQQIVERINQATPEQITAYQGSIGERFEARPDLKPFEKIIRDALEKRAATTAPRAAESIENRESAAAGQEVNTTPSEPMKESGNYKKAHVSVDGLDISIENPIGSFRSGKDKGGREWRQEIKADYGYVKGTVGHDKDHVDIFIKPGYQGGAKTVHVVNQVNKDGSFDEHKAVLGAASPEEAMEIYNSNYEEGWTGGKNVIEMPAGRFKRWAKSGRAKKGELTAAQAGKQPATAAPKESPAKSQGAEQPAPPSPVAPVLNDMVREAARWKGAAQKVAETLTDKKAQLALSRQTTKGDLDAYLMRKFGVDESTARDVSNELTRQNIPADMTADPADFASEPWNTKPTPPAVSTEDRVETSALASDDMRGLSFAVTNKAGAVVTSGTVPALADQKHETSKAEYYRDLADKAGGALYISRTRGAKVSSPEEGLILGRTWQQIQDMQAGKYTPPGVKAKMPEGAVEVYSSSTASDLQPPAPVSKGAESEKESDLPRAETVTEPSTKAAPALTELSLFRNGATHTVPVENLHRYLLEEFGIGGQVENTQQGVAVAINTHQSANTLRKAFSDYDTVVLSKGGELGQYLLIRPKDVRSEGRKQLPAPPADSIPGPTPGEKSPGVSLADLEQQLATATSLKDKRELRKQVKEMKVAQEEPKQAETPAPESTNFPISKHGSAAILVSGNPDDIKAKLAAAGIKAKGRVKKGRGMLFPVRMEGEIMAALGEVKPIKAVPEMTKEEYLSSQQGRGDLWFHEQQIRRRVEGGNFISKNILSEYPELVVELEARIKSGEYSKVRDGELIKYVKGAGKAADRRAAQDNRIVKDSDLETAEDIGSRVQSISKQIEALDDIQNPKDFDKHNEKYRKLVERRETLVNKANTLKRAKSDTVQRDQDRVDTAGETEVAQAVSEEPQGGEEKGSSTEDVGRELSYNKRNRLKGLKWSDLEKMDPSLRVREAVKSKVYPRPDYQAMIDSGMRPQVAHIVKQAYDSIPAKPRKTTDEAIQQYLSAITMAMSRVTGWAESAESDKWLASMADRASRRLQRGAVSVTSMIETPSKSLYDTVFPGGRKAQADEARILGRKFVAAIQPGLDEVVKAMKDIEKGWPGAVKAWQKRGFSIVDGVGATARVFLGENERRGKYASIHIEMGRSGITDYIILDGVESESDPAIKEYIDKTLAGINGKKLLLNKNGKLVSAHDTQESAEAAAEEQTKRKGKETVSDRGISVEQTEREGKQHRKEGEDISTERLAEAFGFSGVNFGNWMKGQGNAKERQLHVNHAYDSFMDLADILGVPPKAISLNGLLGIAIGAQGTGQYAAHFVPGVNEINLTRTGGAGSVAHEWAHALDHYFARQAGLERSSVPFLTETFMGRLQGDIRPEIVGHFKKIVDAMNRRPMTEEELAARREKSEDRTSRNIDGWLKEIRRKAVEGIGPEIMTLRDGQDVPVVSEVDRLVERIRSGDFGEGTVQVTKPAHYNAIPTFLSPAVAELRDLHKTIQRRAPAIDDYKALQANIDSLNYRKSSDEQQAKHIPQTTTEYASNAARLDKGKGGKKYWSTDLEMFARAFDAYVSDKLAENAAKNTYLSHAGRMGETVPTGKEREDISLAFDNLIKIIENKETEKGVALYSTSEGTGKDFLYYDMGEDTSEQAQKDNAKLRAIFTPRAGSVVANSIKVVNVSGAVRNFADRITTVFGRRAVFYRAAPGAGLPNGLIDRNDPKTIYVNVDSGFSPSTIIGHETLHAMRKEQPALYNSLLRAANRNIKVEVFNEYRDKLKRNKFLQGRDINQDYVVEEMLADYLGDQFSKPEFWESLAEQRPSLFKRLVAFVKAFLDDVITNFQGMKNFQSDQFFLDVQKMRDVAVKAMAQYGGAEAFVGMEPMDIRFAEQFGITAEEAQRQYDAVVAEFKGTDQWMKAPNGKPTKLNERQWVQVRTPAFKEWFGPWDSDPKNASKVVDENGEPMVVYHTHGSETELTEFKYAQLPGGESRYDATKKGGFTFALEGLSTGWFTRRENQFKTWKKEDGSNVISGFANFKNPIVIEPGPSEQAEFLDKKRRYAELQQKLNAVRSGKEYLPFKKVGELQQELSELEKDIRPDLQKERQILDLDNQINTGSSLSKTKIAELQRHLTKLAKATGSPKEIRKRQTERGYADPFYQLSKMAKSAHREFPELVPGAALRKALLQEGTDGIILRKTNADTTTSDTEVTDWVVPLTGGTQIKSATGNTGQFSPSTDDIRYSVQQADADYHSDLSEAATNLKNSRPKNDISPWAPIYSTMDYMSKLVGAARRAFQSQMDRHDTRVKFERNILGKLGEDDGLIHYLDNLRKTDKASYDEGGGYLLETDKSGESFRIKRGTGWRVFDKNGENMGTADTQEEANELARDLYNADNAHFITRVEGKDKDGKDVLFWGVAGEKFTTYTDAQREAAKLSREEGRYIKDYEPVKAEWWDVINPKGTTIKTFDDEQAAKVEMILAEADQMEKDGHGAAAIEMVAAFRGATNRAFDLQVADMRQMIKDAEEQGLDMPTVSGPDESRRWAIFDRGRKLAEFESQDLAEEHVTELKKTAPRYQGYTVKRQKDGEIMKEFTMKEMISLMGDLRGSYFPRQRQRGAIVLRAIHPETGEKVRENFDLYAPERETVDPETGQVINSKTRQASNYIKKKFNQATGHVPFVPTLEKRARELRRQGFEISIERDQAMPEAVFEAAHLMASVHSLMTDAMNKSQKQANATMGKAYHEFNKVMTEQLAGIFKARGYLSSRLRRSEDYWQGFETDPTKAIAQYSTGLAAGLAKRQAVKEFVLAVTGRDVSWKSWKEENEGGDWEGYQAFVEDRRIDPVKQPNMYKETMNWGREVFRNEEQADRIIGTLRGLASIKFLGFRVSSAFVNAMNMVQAVPATISALTGGSLTAAFGSIRRAAVAYGKYRMQKGSTEDHKIFAYIHGQGWDAAQFNHEASAALRSKAGNAMSNFIGASMWMFGKVEEANRSMTIHAAYDQFIRQAKASGADLDIDPETGIDTALMLRAKQVSDQSHGIYDKGTAPAWTRGAANPVKMLYTFMKFQHNYLLNMGEMIGRDQWKQAGYMLLSPAILAGAGASLATKALFLALGLGGDGDDPEEKFYAWAEETFGSDTPFRHGLAGFAGINLKGSIQMNNPLPTRLSEVFGAPGAIFTDTAKGIKHFTRGEVYKGVEAIAPTAFGTMSRAVREYREGVTTGGYGQVFYGTEPLKADGMDAALRFFGFNPSWISGIREKQWSEKKVAARLSRRKDEIHSRLKRFLLQDPEDRDMGDYAEIMKMVDSLNEDILAVGRADISPITNKSLKAAMKRAFQPNRREKVRAAENDEE